MKFKVEVYETHVATYEVEAESKEDAVTEALFGNVSPEDATSLIYENVNSEVGISVEEAEESGLDLVKFNESGHDFVADGWVEGLKSVTCIEDCPEAE